MRSLCRITLLGLATFILSLGCGKDSTGPSASSVTGIAGNNQLAAAGAQLPFPLSFTVLGSGGEPLSGVTVNWTVAPAGTATFTPQRSVSNAQGIVTTTVQLGTAPGDIVITATVPGVTPVVFNATILDPCEVLQPYTFGATVSGTLTAGDCNLQGHSVDFYGLDLPAGQQSIRVNMSSTVLDAYLELGRIGSDEFVGFDDDIAPGDITNSQLDAIIASGGAFYILSTSFEPGQTGAYTLAATNRAPAFSDCELVWVTLGVTVVDSIRTSDCTNVVSGMTFYEDFVAIWAEPGTELRITQRSSEMDPKLELLSGTGLLLAENNDSVAGNSTAFVSHTVTTSAPYVILPGTAVAGARGAYTLIVSSSVSPVAPAQAGARTMGGRQQLRFGRVRLPDRFQRASDERVKF